MPIACLCLEGEPPGAPQLGRSLARQSLPLHCPRVGVRQFSTGGGRPEGDAAAEPHEEDVGFGDDQGSPEASELVDLGVTQEGDIGEVPVIGIDEVDLHVVADDQSRSPVQEQVIDEQGVGQTIRGATGGESQVGILQHQFTHRKIILKTSYGTTHRLLSCRIARHPDKPTGQQQPGRLEVLSGARAAE